MTKESYLFAFTDCLFRICPVNRYAAQKQYWTEQKKFQAGESVFEEDMLKKLKNAADKEKEQNDMEYRKMLGVPVQYGGTIQVCQFFNTTFFAIICIFQNKSVRQLTNDKNF